MQKYIKLPFLFLFVAACIGLLLRWNFISPVQGLTFPYWLHAHSHLMFLGWIFNLLSLAFIMDQIEESKHGKYLKLFLFIQVLLVGMLISFPFQGYGVYSITISTLHTVAVGIFAFWFFRDTKAPFDPSRWFARVSLIFFLISAIGPFSLGPLMVNGLAQSKWYYLAIYYYLHFQYNGVFTFGVFSLFFGLLKHQQVAINSSTVKQFGYLMVISCVLGYSLSTLWTNPGWIFNAIGLISAIIQLIAFRFFLKLLKPIPARVIKSISASSKLFFVIAFLSWTVKLTLQLISAFPSVAQIAYETRNYVMAYLHLVMLGMITCFLLAWSMERKWIKQLSKPIVVLFLIGFIGMEIVLINPIPLNHSLLNATNFLFLFSGLLVLAIGKITVDAFSKERE